MSSGRFPGKLLAEWRGRTVLEATIGIGAACGFGAVVVATADDAIAEVAARAGAEVTRTSARPRNGTERVAEALASGALGDVDAVVNLQGDAVGATPALVRAAVDGLRRAPLATVATRSGDSDAGGRTTVTARGGFAVDFSRAELDPGDVDAARLLHVGVYAYRSDALAAVAELARSGRERAESLEQLRWLDRGWAVALEVVGGGVSGAHAIDRPADLRHA